MKKLLLVSLCFLMLSITQVFAQNRTVTGTVTAKDDGLPIPGVTVKVKGSNNGTQTNGAGKFTLSAPAGATLTFTFIGYQPHDAVVGASGVVNAVLLLNTKGLNEVVVTALGISQEKKVLGYSQTTVKGDVINKSAPIDLLGGLQGKVAGMTISEVSGTPGGSTKVILRGYSSLQGSNQPLYVVDGVPFDNSRSGSDDNYDFGNGADDIDPNIVDNISVLKGAAATALYGERGSNGVILITTKKGKSGKPVVDVSTGTMLTNVAITYKPQEEFGQGWNGTFILSENGDWGPKYDGVLRPWGATGSGTGATIGNTQLLKPFSFLPNNVSDAFDTGLELNNNVSVSGGNDNSTYFMSYSNVYANGILPGNPDVYKRNNFSLRGTTKYKNFTADASLNYVNDVRNTPATGQGSSDGQTFYESLLQIPSDIPIKDLRDYKNIFFNTDNYFTPYAENPYYDLYENGSRQTTNRLYGNINLSYKITDWFTLNFQQSADVTNRQGKIWNNKNAPALGSWNAGNNVEGASRAADLGSVAEEANNVFEYDSKLQGLFTKKINSDFDINGVIGTEYDDRGNRDLTTSVENLTFPGFYQINNSSNKPTSTDVVNHQRLLSFYAQATLGYKDNLFLTLSGRNDNTSTLAPGNNSYVYPAASLAWVFTQALNMKSPILTFGKLRASYGETGTDTSPYNIFDTLSAANIPLGFGHITFPLNGVSGYTVANTLLNPNLKPARIKELEVGGEFRFLNDRLGLDATYYSKSNANQIIDAPVSPGSGYEFEIVNFGKVTNKGIEIAISATPIKTSTFQWDVNYTFSHDQTKVVSLAPGISTYEENSAYDAQELAIPGLPIASIFAPIPARDPQGHIIVNAKGYPIQNTTVDPKTGTALGDYGSVAPQFRMGLVNTIRVQNFSLGFTFDYSQGGVFYSGTADLLNFIGADIKTTYNDRNPFIVPNSVQAITATGGKTTYIENTQQISGQNIANMYYPTTNIGTSYQQRILTRTFIKLREVTLNYNLPKTYASAVGASKASIGIFGRNLWTWLPPGNQTIDPEVSNQGSDLASEFGEFRSAPPLKYYGATLKVSF